MRDWFKYTKYAFIITRFSKNAVKFLVINTAETLNVSLHVNTQNGILDYEYIFFQMFVSAITAQFIVLTIQKKIGLRKLLSFLHNFSPTVLTIDKATGSSFNSLIAWAKNAIKNTLF